MTARRSTDPWGLAAPATCGLERPAPEVLDSPDQVRDRLAELASGGATGWCCFTDRVARVTGGGGMDTGLPLYAELCAGDRSWSLQQDGESWLLSSLRRTDGDSHLVITHRYLGVEPGRSQPTQSMAAVYEVFWPAGNEDHQGALDRAWERPVGPETSRFVALEPLTRRTAAGGGGDDAE